MLINIIFAVILSALPAIITIITIYSFAVSETPFRGDDDMVEDFKEMFYNHRYNTLQIAFRNIFRSPLSYIPMAIIFFFVAAITTAVFTLPGLLNSLALGEDGEYIIAEMFMPFELLSAVLITAAVIFGSLLIAVLVYIRAVERKDNFDFVKMMQYSEFTIIRLLFFEMLLVCIIGAGAGFAASYYGLPYYSGYIENRIEEIEASKEAEIQKDLIIEKKSFVAEKHEVEMFLYFQEKQNIEKWQLIIVDNSGKTNRTFEGDADDFPSKIVWDGKKDDGEYVFGGDIFTIQLLVETKFGRVWKSEKRKLESEIETSEEEAGRLSFQMSTLQFNSGSARLNTNSEVLLDRVAKILKRYPAYDIKVQGHTDDEGSKQANLYLSRKRAESVVDYLVNQSEIKRERFTTVGLGSSKPVAPNTSDANKAKNRRVEFVLTKPE